MKREKESDENKTQIKQQKQTKKQNNNKNKKDNTIIVEEERVSRPLQTRNETSFRFTTVTNRNVILLHETYSQADGQLDERTDRQTDRCRLIAILKGLYLLIFLHLSALMNRLALSDLLMKSCSKFQSEISNHLNNFLSVSWHRLSGILCRQL